MTNYAKFSGNQFEVLPLHAGKVQFFQGQGEIVTTTKHSGEGEEDKFVFTIRPKFVEWSEGETENSIPVNKSISHFSKSMSPSQKLRWIIYKKWESGGSIGDPDEFYRKRMFIITQNEEET